MTSANLHDQGPNSNGEHADRAARAVQLLERARDAGCQDDRALYFLGLAYLRHGKRLEARAAFRQIAKPDAHLFLQLGLLSLREHQLGQAEQELARAHQLDSSLFAACYNLLFTRLSLGQTKGSADLAAKAAKLAPTEQQRRRLELLGAWLSSCALRRADKTFDPLLVGVSSEEEGPLIEMARRLGRLDVTLEMLEVLAAARPMSGAAQEAYVEAVLVRARQLIERCEWTEAERLLQPLAREHGIAKANQVALRNLLGVCACLNQDAETGQDFFREALKLAPSDPRVHQNLALSLELRNRLSDAEPHWNRFFDLIDRRLPGPPGADDHHEHVAFVGLARLAGKFAEKEKWEKAVPYQQRAVRLRPKDVDALERLFQLFAHAKRPDDARRVLRQLQDLNPREPQYLLYELDLIDVNKLKDVEYLLGEIERVHGQYPNDSRVEEKAVSLVGNVIPLMGSLCDQLTDQLNRVLGQIRRLPNYQINWPAVYDVMADLQREFNKLRRITNRCLPLVRNDEQRRVIRNLADHIDKKIDVCRSVRA